MYGRRLFLLAIIAAAILFVCAGCFTRTIYVPPGKSVRLRQDVTAKVWVLDSSGKPVPGKMTLREGWHVVPPAPGGE